MNDYVLECAGQRVGFVTDVDDGEVLRALSARFRQATSDPAPGFRLVYLDRPTTSLSWDGEGELTFAAPWRQVRGSYALETLSNLAFYYTLATQGIHVLHAAAVSRGGSALLLFGEAGSGKSVTSITLCLHHGYRLMSNGSTLVTLADDSAAVRVLGTLKPGLKLRYSSLHRAYPEHALALFPEGPRESEFDTKRTVAAERIGIDVDGEPRPGFRLHQVRLSGAAFTARKLDGHRLRLVLYEDLSRRVRAAGTLLLLGTPARPSVRVPSLDSPRLHGLRRAFIETVVDRALGDSLRGSPREVARWVAVRHEASE